MAQSNYSKDFHAGDDFMVRGYNLTRAAKCWWGLERLLNKVHVGDELPILKIRFGPADTAIALARSLSYDTLPPSPRNDVISVAETLLPAHIMMGASMEDLYSDMLEPSDKDVSKTWSRLMLSLSSGPILNESGKHHLCMLCPGQPRMDPGHILQNPLHCKRLKRYHNVERHEWDRDNGCWIDVPVKATEKTTS